MILFSMAFAMLVSALIVVAAVGADGVARVLRLPTRWAWAAALALSVGLSTAALVVRPTVSAPVDQSLFGGIQTSASRAPTGWLARTRATVTAATRWFDASTYARFQRTDLSRVPRTAVFAAWGATSVVLAILFACVHARLRSVRRQWPREEVMGVRVRLAPQIGPAAIGLARPEIVIPRWLVSRPGSEQRMAIEHEAQHLRARDPQLLAIACLAAIVFPWNLAVWYMLSRLRLAIEVDCDARVLRAGTAAAEYGSLLLTVAEYASPIRPSVLALADDASHLHSRIVAMDHRVTRSTRARAAAMGLLGAVALLVACEAKAPTAADLDGLDGAKAESAARRLGMLTNPDSGVIYRIDGAVVSPEVARKLDGDRISQINVRRPTGGKAEILITSSATPIVDTARRMPRKGPPANGDLASLLPRRDTAIVWFVNGARATYEDAMKMVDKRENIESIDVIKGPAAEAMYNVPPGHGVIAIRTKN
jgi:beta-lactamase regulating signal transducer with metallopeptidase domain